MRRCLPVLFLLFALPQAASAATRTWTGTTSGSWTLAANWGGTAPVLNDDLVFPAGAGNLTNNNDFFPFSAFNSITVTGAGYTLNSTLPTNLGAGGISSSTGTVTINIDFSLTAAQAWTVTGGLLIMNGDLGLSGQTLTLSATTGAGFLNGNIVNNGTIIKQGTGDWTMNGANTFTGQIQINAGRLIANTATVFGVADDTLANGTVVNSGGTLAFAGGLTYPTELLTIDGAGEGGLGVLQAGAGTVLTGTVSVGSGTAMFLQPGQTIRFNGIVTGAGRFGMGGPGTYILNNAGNNFSGGVLWGATSSSDSTLRLQCNNCVPDSVALNIPASGAFDVNDNQETITSIAGAGTVTLGILIGRLTITGGATTFSGAINGVGSVTHTGGTLTLTGVSTGAVSYSNTNGTTIVTGTGAFPGSYTQSNGTLGLSTNGTMGSVTINGGTFEPGNSGNGIGNTGNLTLAAAVTYGETINGTAAPVFGNVHVTGAVNLGGATFSLNGSGAGVVAGNTFTIIDNDAADAVAGTFAGLPEGATIPGGPGGLNYTISYIGGTGNDVVLTAAAPAAIPALDPRALIALAFVLGAIAVLMLRR